MALDVKARAELDRVLKIGGDERFSAKRAFARRMMRVSDVSCILCGCAGIALGLALVHEAQPYFLVGLAAVVLGTMLLVVWSADLGRNERLWRPLSEEPTKCELALELVRAHPAAREVRDAIVATGRQLYVADFRVMRLAVEPEMERRARERDDQADRDAQAKQRAVCTELHGIGSA